MSNISFPAPISHRVGPDGVSLRHRSFPRANLRHHSHCLFFCQQVSSSAFCEKVCSRRRSHAQICPKPQVHYCLEAMRDGKTHYSNMLCKPWHPPTSKEPLKIGPQKRYSKRNGLQAFHMRSSHNEFCKGPTEMATQRMILDSTDITILKRIMGNKTRRGDKAE